MEYKDDEDLQQQVSRITRAILTDDEITQDTKAKLDQLNKVYGSCKADKYKLKAACNAMLENGIVDIFIKIWDVVHKVNVYNRLTTLHGQTLQSLKELFWNFSDKCADLSKVVCKHGEVIPRMMNELRSDEMQMDTLEDDYRRHHIKATFGTLHNFVRHYEDNISQVRKDGGLNCLKCYCESGYLIIQAYAYILLTYCAGRDEIQKFLPGTEVLEFILKLTQSTLESPDHVSAMYGLSAMEVIDALCKSASSNDENKRAIVEAGFLPVLGKMLDYKNFSDEEVYLAITCIWHLTLDDVAARGVKKDPQLKKALDVLAKGTNSRVKMSSKDVIHVLWPGRGPAPKKRHIMLSYQWDSKEKMKKLHMYLVKEGFSLWMDVHDMKMNVYDSMASAVENASVVIMGVTEKYKESKSCEKEAKYAQKRGVNILPVILQAGYADNVDGWLGLIMSDTLYIDLSVPDYESKFGEVKQKLTSLV